MAINHHEFMSRAVQLARKGLYTTHPNPRVGCVIVKDGQIIGEGFHKKAGEGHAEVQALASLTTDAKGATAYVTLEPCSHYGRTPPCAEALIKAGVATVVYGMQDPNPQVAGNGLKMLADAGIEVLGPVLENECRALNPGFIKRMEEGLPYVRVKMAMSVDGRTAMESGESQWITGPEARQDVQRLRAQSSAVVTGIGSVIMDTALSIPPEAKILYPTNEVLVFCDEEEIEADHLKALQKKKVDVRFLPLADDGRLDLVEAMGQLADDGINEVLVETGAVLAGAFLDSGLVDELVIYMAPKLLGSEARPLLSLPLEHMSDAVELNLLDMAKVGNDIKLVYQPIYREEEDA